jgi:hypothetical protein
MLPQKKERGKEEEFTTERRHHRGRGKKRKFSLPFFSFFLRGKFTK